MRISELSRRFPAVNVARWGGGVIQSYGGDASRVELDFDTQREGFIWIKFAGKRALVHKDELTYFARFAKGHAGV